MHEDVLAAVIGRDVAKALGVVEPLHRTCAHVCSLCSLMARTSAMRAPGQKARRERTVRRYELLRPDGYVTDLDPALPLYRYRLRPSNPRWHQRMVTSANPNARAARASPFRPRGAA